MATDAKGPPVPDTEETRQAAIDTARAGADKARADALKAEADARKAEADASKAAADARSAAAKAASDERDAAQANSALGQKQRDTASRQKIAEAEKATSTAQAERIATYVPDLSKIERGKLDLEKAEVPLFAGALENEALNAAAVRVAEGLRNAELPDEACVLVTSDAELAASHAAYLEVIEGLDRIDAAATGLLADVKAPGEPEREPEEGAEPEVELESLTVGAIAQTLATALPGALSLFAAHRAVATSETTVEDLEAAAAVAGQLLLDDGWPLTIVHDNFRLLTDGPLRRKLKQTNTRRQELVSRHVALGDEKARGAKDLAVAKAKLEAAKAAVKASPDDLEAKNAVQTGTDEVAAAELRLAETELRLGLVVSVIEAIDSFVNSLTAVPEGATRSALTLAAMREGIRPVTEREAGQKPASDDVTHVLLVKGNGGSATQVIDDRPLWMADRFASIGTARITYLLIDSGTNALLAAGDASGTAKVSGKLSTNLGHEFKRLTFERDPSPPPPRELTDTRSSTPSGQS